MSLNMCIYKFLNCRLEFEYLAMFYRNYANRDIYHLEKDTEVVHYTHEQIYLHGTNSNLLQKWRLVLFL